MDKDLGQVLTGNAVTLTKDNLGPLLYKLRCLHESPLCNIASDCHTSPDTIRTVERTDGTQYIGLPLLFRFLAILGLELKIQKKGSDDE